MQAGRGHYGLAEVVIMEITIQQITSNTMVFMVAPVSECRWVSRRSVGSALIEFRSREPFVVLKVKVSPAANGILPGLIVNLIAPLSETYCAPVEALLDCVPLTESSPFTVQLAKLGYKRYSPSFRHGFLVIRIHGGYIAVANIARALWGCCGGMYGNLSSSGGKRPCIPYHILIEQRLRRL